MNIIEQPPANWLNGDHALDDGDRLLRDFFRAEMPNPWPVLQVPGKLRTEQVRTVRSHWLLGRSRLALAASVALLMVGLWFMKGNFPSDGPALNPVRPEARQLPASDLPESTSEKSIAPNAKAP